MVRLVSTWSVAVLGLLRDPGCGGVDDPNGGPNAPCTRSSDCGSKLACIEGVCRDPDGGASDASTATRDAGPDGG